MSEATIPNNGLLTELAMQVIVSEDDNSVYVKLSGFDDNDDANNYADFLTKNLPLLLFETEVVH
jgi:hypothetical protein